MDDNATINNLPLTEWMTLVSDNARLHRERGELAEKLSKIEELVTRGMTKYAETHPENADLAPYYGVLARDLGPILGLDIEAITKSLVEKAERIDEGYQE